DREHGGDAQQRVAVRLRTRGGDNPDVAARTGAVVGDGGELPALRELRPNEARQNVGARARAMRRDQSQRATPNPIAVLRQRTRTTKDERRQRNRKRNPGRVLHRISCYDEWVKTLSIRAMSGANALVSRSSRAMMAMVTCGSSGSTPGSSITSGGVTTERGS